MDLQKLQPSCDDELDLILYKILLIIIFLWLCDLIFFYLYILSKIKNFRNVK